MRRISLKCAFVLLMVQTAGTASADLLNLPFPHYPRVWNIAIGVSYTLPDNPSPTDTGDFTAIGYSSQQYTDGEGSLVILDGDFVLNAVLRQDGTFVSGDLTVDGDWLNPDTSLLFHSSKLTAFGYGGDDLFEFKFTEEGNYLAPDGENVGVILAGTSIPQFDETHPPVFTSSFDNMYDGTANVFYMPEPTTCLLLGLASLGLARVRRRA